MKILHYFRLLPATSWFMIYSVMPSQALAFSGSLNQAKEQIVFFRDQSLAEFAVVGIEAFPKDFAIPVSSTAAKAAGKQMRVLATAYSSTGAQTDSSPFVTASGTLVHPGTLAANFLPFGTQLRIGSRIYIVEDRMNARYNDTYIIDLWMPSLSAAKQFGLQIVEMEIVSLP